MHDHVDHAMIEQIFAGLEIVRQFFADGVFDHPAAGKGQRGARFGQMQIAKQRIACHHAAGGRVGQHHDIGQTGIFQPLHAHGHLGHLHQREDTLLHARAAAGGENDIGAVVLDRRLGAQNEGFAHTKAHGAAHEGKILHADHGLLLGDFAHGVDQCIAFPSGLTRLLQPVDIAFGIAKFQRILAHQRRRQRCPAALVEQGFETLRGPDAAMMVAAGADMLIVLIFLEEHHLAAALALVPQLLAGLALGDEGDRVADAVEPGHADAFLAF